MWSSDGGPTEMEFHPTSRRRQAMNTKEFEIYRKADEMYRQGPDWVTFFRQILGVNGIVRIAFPESAQLTAFEKTAEYMAIQQMLAKLRERARANLRAADCSLFGFAPGGVYLARLVTQPAGELLPHRFTLTSRCRGGRGAVCFLLHFPWPCGRWALPTALSCGARTFLPPSLISAGGPPARSEPIG